MLWPVLNLLENKAKIVAESLVTIILTTLNSESFLSRSIESCLAQTHSNFELLIVDGGSTDRTLAIVNSYNDPRIQIIHQPENSGKLPGALNLGMAHAKGDFITWTQDDCWYEPTAIQIMVDYMQAHLDIDLVYTDYWFVDEQAQPISYQPARDPKHIVEGGDIIGQCFLFRRQVYEAVGPQEIRFFPVHEIPWRFLVFEQFVIQPLSNPLMYYTVHDHSLTGEIGPWKLQRLSAKALLEAGFFDQEMYKKRIGQLDIGQAYEEFVLHGNYRAFWVHLIPGLRYDKKSLYNWGLLKLAIISILPWRNAYRKKLFTEWKAKRTAKLSEMISKHLPKRWKINDPN